MGLIAIGKGTCTAQVLGSGAQDQLLHSPKPPIQLLRLLKFCQRGLRLLRDVDSSGQIGLGTLGFGQRFTEAPSFMHVCGCRPRKATAEPPKTSSPKASLDWVGGNWLAGRGQSVVGRRLRRPHRRFRRARRRRPCGPRRRRRSSSTTTSSA